MNEQAKAGTKSLFIGALVLVAMIICVVLGGSAGSTIQTALPASLLVTSAVAMSLLPVVILWIGVRKRQLGAIALWFVTVSFGVTFVVPVWAGVGSQLLSRGIWRQLFLLTATLLSWAVQIGALALVSRSASPAGRKSRIQNYVVDITAPLVPPLASVLILTAIGKPLSIIPSAFAAAVVVFVVFACRLIVDTVYLWWLQLNGEQCPQRLLDAIDEMGITVGVGFDVCVALPIEWPHDVCETRLGHVRRPTIVMSRSVVDRMTDAELRALVAHELKHVIGRDIEKSLLIAAVAAYVSVVTLLALGGIRATVVTRAPTASLLALVFTVFILRVLVEMAMSRRRERAADMFAAGLVGRPAVKSALTKLAGDRLAHLKTSPWSTHDALARRLAALDSPEI